MESDAFVKFRFPQLILWHYCFDIDILICYHSLNKYCICRHPPMKYSGYTINL